MRSSSARASASRSPSPQQASAIFCTSVTRTARRSCPRYCALGSALRAHRRDRGRLSAEGEVLKTLDEAAANAEFAKLRAAGFSAIAIVLMHAYRYPAHEKRLAELARAAGFAQVSTSHETSPLMKIVSRGETTVLDAYLTPVLRRWLARVASAVLGRAHASPSCNRTAG
ncbi:MAG: hydantoinase/oxoprolinase N-terminal domain-containing protein [Alphaproteobacteria bacterium]